MTVWGNYQFKDENELISLPRTQLVSLPLYAKIVRTLGEQNLRESERENLFVLQYVLFVEIN